MSRILVDVDKMAMGWDQFLNTAYSMAKHSRWDQFDNIDVIVNGIEIDIKIFKNNFLMLTQFSKFVFTDLAPMSILRSIARDYAWEGFMNLGPTRKKQRAFFVYYDGLDQTQIGKMDYFLMTEDKPNPYGHHDAKELAEYIQHGLDLIVAFERLDDLVTARMML